MSTPIETNTAELQEILQTVYNLPMAGGGSAEPDLVIGFDDINGIGLDSPDQLTFNPAEVIATYNKLLAGETVSCVLNSKYWVDSGGPVDASSPQMVAFAKSYGAAQPQVAGMLRVYFNLVRFYTVNGIWTFVIDFNILRDGSVENAYASFTATSHFSSTVYPGNNG